MASVSSHIQMPKCVLKNFADEKQTLYYYDFITKTIRYGRAATLNTEHGYYSQKVENYLRDNVEAPLGHVMAHIKRISINDKFSVSENFCDSVRTFVYALMSRGNGMLSSTENNSLFFQFYPSQAQHDYVVVQGIELAKNQGLLDNWQITFLINNSNIPFVLPLQGFYQFGLRSQKSVCMNLPISPSYAITLIPNIYINNFIEDGVAKMFTIEESKTVHDLNKLAFLSEQRHNAKYIIANQRQEIESLVNELVTA